MMFEALVLVCVLFQPGHCFPVGDNRGPYKTYEECQARTTEMTKDIIENIPYHIPQGWKCAKSEGVGT